MQASLSPERWEQVQRLFDEAIDLQGEDRAALLDEACRDDPDLRREVESLLAAYEQADDLLQDIDQMVLTALPSVPASPPAPSRTGMTVSHYEVIEKLGSGGMGVVYAARDTKLDRLAALKFLPPHLSASAEAKARFVHEAKAASALDHANICTIYEIGETDDGQTFIAMAHYRGQTLKHKIEQGPLPLAQTLDYAIQMARGLGRAHEEAIVHRDVKPANVMVTKRGVVKMLDFGLAKMADVQLTKTGTTMGTVSYMSPEQARGDRVDARTDVWSLGVVLYEMLTGERPFKGEFEQAILYSLLNEAPPPVTKINPEVPEELAHIVGMCLEKDRDRRYPTMEAVLADLEMVGQGLGPGSTTAQRAVQQRRRKVRQRIVVGAGAVGGLALLTALAFMIFFPTEQHVAVVPFINNLSKDPIDQALVDGVMQSLTGMIARMEASKTPLWVVPAEEVASQGVETAGDARRIFGVNRVVTGSMQRQGVEIELRLNLVDPGTMQTLRTRTATAALGSAFQKEVLRALEGLLKVDVKAETRQVVETIGSTVPNAYAFYLQGLGFLRRFDKAGNLDNAIQLFTSSVKADSLYALAHAGLCEASWEYYQSTFDAVWIDRALQNCDQAVILNDQLASVRVTLGRIFSQRGQPRRAEEELQRALELEPFNTDAYRWLGWVYEEKGDAVEAEKAYQQAIALKPEYWVNYSLLGNFYFLAGRHEEAATQFEHIIRLTPDNYAGYSDLGIVRLDMGHEQEAERLFERSIGLKPTVLTYLNLGRVRYRNRRYAEAAQAFEQARAINDKDDVVWQFLGNAYYWAGDTQRARIAWRRSIELADQALAVNPNDDGVLGSLVVLHLALGDFEQGRRYLGLLFALPQPLNPYRLHWVGRAYEILGERALALRYVTRALEDGVPLVRIETDPWLDALRGTDAYRALREQIAQAASQPPG